MVHADRNVTFTLTLHGFTRNWQSFPLKSGEDQIDVRLLVDQSSVEAFAMGGRSAITSTFRGKGTAAHVFAAQVGSTPVIEHVEVSMLRADVWSVGCGWVDTDV